MMNTLLTLVVCLKDRAEFTQRFCQYLSECKFPFKVVFADGSVGDENQQYFSSLGEIDFEYSYTRYPVDSNKLLYYKKISSAIEQVSTPYVMIADNDDFPIVNGLQQAIAFLEKNQDFVGCNGQVAGISLAPDPSAVKAKHLLLHRYYCGSMDVPVELNQPSAVLRINAYLENFYSIYYSVFRTNALAHTLEQIVELDFTDWGVHELYFSYMQLAQGKIHTLPCVTYVRQKGSSQLASTQKDWFYRLFYTDWLQDCKKGIHSVAQFVAKHENDCAQLVFDKLYADFVDKMRSRFTVKPVSIFGQKNILRRIVYRLSQYLPSISEFISFKMDIKKQAISPVVKIVKQGTKPLVTRSSST